MLGAIIGDIVGSQYEFDNYKNTDFTLFGSNCYSTDDTVCTIAIADAILSNKSFEQSLQYWCKKYPDPMGGYGGSFAQWVHSSNPHPYNSFGNGSAMRVSPCARISEDRLLVLESARKSAECTHNHPEGIKGAVVVADCIWHARFGRTKHEIKCLVTNEYGYDLSKNCDEIRATNTFDETCQVTVPQAIMTFLESTDFESAVRLAVSIGGDSDTIAAITGSIAEAFYKIPNRIGQKALSYLPNEFILILNKFYDKYYGVNRLPSIYKYYKGEQENPYKADHLNNRNDEGAMIKCYLWDAEMFYNRTDNSMPIGEYIFAIISKWTWDDFFAEKAMNVWLLQNH